MQVLDGIYEGREEGKATPTFWIWCLAGATVEYWVLLRPGQVNGFQFVADGTTVRWTITSVSGIQPLDGCDFRTKIAEVYGHPLADLIVRKHDVQTVPCP